MTLDVTPVQSPCPPVPHRKSYFTVTETAGVIHYSPGAVYRFIRWGYLEAYNPGGVGFQRISCCAITAFMEARHDREGS